MRNKLKIAADAINYQPPAYARRKSRMLWGVFVTECVADLLKMETSASQRW